MSELDSQYELTPSAADCHTFSNKELLPCPFCGSSAITTQGFESDLGIVSYRAVCIHCRAEVSASECWGNDAAQVARARAVALWNTRTEAK
jgi:Lar family restriction alleviation protein